jgi:hypothetical protein
MCHIMRRRMHVSYVVGLDRLRTRVCVSVTRLAGQHD